MISEMDPDKIDYDKYEAVMGQVINSAIVYPNVDQEFKITKSSPFIPIKGWAVGNQYAGHPVDKVEVSLDQGQTWVLANITRRESKNEGKIFSWVFWEYVLDPNEYITD